MTRHRFGSIILSLAVLVGAQAATAQVNPAPGSAPRLQGAKADRRLAPEPLARVLKGLGDQLLAEHVQEVGAETDAALVRDLQAVEARLEDANGLRDRDLTLRLVRTTDVNAGTFPGGRIYVNVGVLTLAHRIAAQMHDERPERERYLGLVATVVAHEMGHAILGHPDSAAARDLRSRFAAMRFDGEPTRAQLDTALRQLVRDSARMNAWRRQRTQEQEADRYGALAMFRAHWFIQDAIDFFRFTEDEERSTLPAGVLAGLDDLTWFRDHPRSSLRGAELEVLRAGLKRDQARLDDAIVLTEQGVMLDSAAAMLDTVLAHFPELPAARHARAAVLHQTWLALRTPAQLEVQTITATYGADVGRRVRGADRELARARAAYVDALRYGAHAYTLANLAVLDAYANDNALAVQRADSALALAPNDTVVRLNVAAVRYLVGDYARARALLEPIARDVAPAAFDLGRTLLALGDTARAADAFRRYLAVRPPEPWAREVRRLVPAAYTQVPRPTNDEPPTVAGIHLGDSPTAVVARLGEPSEQRADGAARLLVFEPKGLAVVFHDGDAATSIILFAPQAGDLVEGVRVGGAASAAALRLGRPELLAHGAQHFARNGYGVVVEPQDGVIVRVRIVRE